jgi:small-conductance mechanosensitive channel/CRP-like cAMP-binding protein
MFLVNLASFIYQSFSDALTKELLNNGVLSFIVVALFGAVIVARIVPEKRKHLKGVLIPLVIYIFFLVIAIFLDVNNASNYSSYIRALATAFISVSLINLGSLTVFDVVLGGLHLKIPRLLRDTAVILTYVITTLIILSSRGINVTGLLTTSAIISAVIGLSLQDTLGNIIAGFALEIEHIIQPGDWIKVEPYIGKIKEIRWRQTVIETRNWDTVLIPNSQIMKSQVMIYGRRQGQPLQTRRWIYFNIDFRFTPDEVINCVNQALQANPIPNVADEPRIHAILMDFKDSYCTYAVRYWLTDIAVDDPTDSSVRIRIFYALKRADIPLSIPAHSLFVTELSNKRQIRKHEQEIEQKLANLRNVELLRTMTESELRELATHVRYAPFAKGEVITRQGAEAHWLYIIIKGEVSVRVSVININGIQGTKNLATEATKNLTVEKEVSRLKAGSFFGEMSLMTGEPRASTVVALEEVECYRLDKAAFESILSERPEIAKDISKVLARRRVELESVKQGLDKEIHQEQVDATQVHILKSIKDFFGL